MTNNPVINMDDLDNKLELIDIANEAIRNAKALAYCKDCNSRDTWERTLERDVYYESGKLIMMSYHCRICGAKTLISAK